MNTPQETFRPHPIYIVHILRKFLFILLIPLIRSVFHAITGQLSTWTQGIWIDLLILFLFFFVGFSLWMAFKITVTPASLFVEQGILFRRVVAIPLNRLTCLTKVCYFYLKPLRAARLRIDTPGGRIPQADLVLTISLRDWEKIRSLFEPVTKEMKFSKIYIPKDSYIFLLSALTSNSFAGVILLSTLITQMGNLLGSEFSERIYGAFEDTTRFLAVGIPPFAVAFAVLLLFGWIYSFALHAIRHQNLTIRRTSSMLEIKGGLFTKRAYFLSRAQIGFLDIRQTVLTKMLHVYSVFVYTIGYRKYNDDLDSIVPFADFKNLRNSLSLLLPEYRLSDKQVFPKTSFIKCPPIPMFPLWTCVLIPVLTLMLANLFSSWRSVILWGSLFCEIPALWYLMVRFMDGFSSGISINGTCWTLRYSKKFHFHTVLIERDKISNIVLFQTPFQKWSGRCYFILYSYTERRNIHLIRNLPFLETQEFLRKHHFC